MIDLGTANSWRDEPEIVAKCERVLEHTNRKFEKRGECLTRITCEECGYFFEIDSSD